MNGRSRVPEIVNYSFLVVFANDGTIDADELKFIEKLALEDGVVDDAERDVLRGIFSRIDPDQLGDEVKTEIHAFRARYGI